MFCWVYRVPLTYSFKRGNQFLVLGVLFDRLWYFGEVLFPFYLVPRCNLCVYVYIHMYAYILCIYTHVFIYVYVYTCVCENPSYKNIQRSCRDAGEGLGDPSPQSGSERDGCRWEALRHHLGRQGGPKVPQKRDTSLVTRDVPSTSTPPVPKRHLTLSL